jgi:hypothetical protein
MMETTMQQKPWKGSEYEPLRLLILGESAYSWMEEGELRHPSENHPTVIVNESINDFEKMGRAVFLRE